ncbi:MAG: translation elongation factor 4 [Patescibacteria group bacterium]|nr:translation elongation factor 4 [Patescibacteria group bacterium]
METSNIRNFAIIAHVDHGKSTLADRLLEITKTVSKEKMKEQFLDQNPISRERGITIKLAPVRMNYRLNDTNYMLNLIDTPGHVDFSYEVSRTLACCEGVVLLVDATQGIQAQTVAHYNSAKKENLAVIPVVNKIDLPNSQPELTAKSMCEAFGFSQDEIIYVSAKTGDNVELLLKTIIEKIPAPYSTKSYLRGLVFDAVYDEHRGVIAFIKVKDGSIKPHERIKFYQTGVESDVIELGFFSPFLTPSKSLQEGEIGYVITGIKDIRLCKVGDTLQKTEDRTQRIENDFEPLTGYKEAKPMVFFGVYPKSTNDFVHLKESLAKLILTDAALSLEEEHSAFLGSGFRVGFLGLLHAEIIKERLTKEYLIDPLFTMPQVLYEKKNDGSIFEPYASLSVYTPQAYIGSIMSLCQKNKGNLIDMKYHESYSTLIYEIPYVMIVRGLSSKIKSVSSGFASIDYELIDFRQANVINLEIRVNDNPIDVLSELVYKEDAFHIGREKVEKLKKTLKRQQFRQVIQAFMEGKTIAREEIPPFRKDVIAKLSGGDRTRKDKLLKKQKKGKSKLFSTSKVDISQEALFSFLEGE